MNALARTFAFDPDAIVANTVILALAFLIALPVGWEREVAKRAAGIRTFSLVAVASAGFVLIGRTALGEEGNMHYVLQGLMTGLGFLGAGVIMQRGCGEPVRGTATAVALWSTAAIGAAVAYGKLEIAILLAALDVIGLRLMRRVQRRIATDGEARAARREPHGAAP